MIKKLNNENFEAEVLNSVETVLVKFSSPTCRPCQMMAPILKDAVEKYAGKMTIGEVDISDSMEIARKYRVMAVPTLILFKNGEDVKQFVGYMDLDDIDATFGEFL